MGVDELAIQAHEKGEIEHDTYHTITLMEDDNIEKNSTEGGGKRLIRIVKRSRVNNDLIVELELEKEHVEHLAPGKREKKSLATSNAWGQHLLIASSLLTVNGLATVVDDKKLLKVCGEETVMLQDLTITNVVAGISHKTVRYFIPYNLIPPHLESNTNVDQDMPDSTK
eukprot:CAMPEP_0194135842 /NCGR_PEP_ID=MMETSP0152-20130528/5920_1 /TAXON_ID=1049557 /ORGANISM="Thalassiothrix antarctica, Strain L6-D1" /LENGTH=168 /DNA_ID=CAMNT_0038832261 /DNA_START=140 /DNA_END=646 /DNA_ORIENTATION=-